MHIMGGTSAAVPVPVYGPNQALYPALVQIRLIANPCTHHDFTTSTFKVGGAMIRKWFRIRLHADKTISHDGRNSAKLPGQSLDLYAPAAFRMASNIVFVSHNPHPHDPISNGGLGFTEPNGRRSKCYP
jgi:hypothetical protein